MMATAHDSRTRLVLVRHAEPQRQTGQSGPADPPLTDRGRQQARLAAEYLADETFDAVYSSPMLRARETAEALVRGRPVPVEVEDGLAEYDRDLTEYVPFEEARETGNAHYRAIMTEDFASIGVDIEAFKRTVVGTVHDICQHHGGQRVLLVCHGGVMNAYVGDVLGVSRLLVFAAPYTGIARVHVEEGRRTLVTLNERPHRCARRPATAADELQASTVGEAR